MIANKQKLQLAMAKSCLTSGDLQKKSGLPRGTFLNVIAGKNVKPATIGKVARAMNVDVTEIIEV